MRRIAPSIRKKIGTEIYFKKCCLCEKKQLEGYKIEVHHNLIYGGRQADSYFTLLPLCVECHRKADNTDIKEKLDWIMLSRATWGDLTRYSRVNWIQKKKYLESKFGAIPTLNLHNKNTIV